MCIKITDLSKQYEIGIDRKYVLSVWVKIFLLYLKFFFFVFIKKANVN